jgi:outer membrane lipoprotein-sorting protein
MLRAFFTLASFFTLIFVFSMARPALGNKVGDRKSLCSPKACILLRDLQGKYKGFKDLKAQFEQFEFIKSSQMTKESQGRLLIQKPAKVLFEVESPEKSRSLFVTNGNIAWFYTPPLFEDDQAQVIRKDLRKTGEDSLANHFALRLVSGQANFRTEFRSKVVDADEIKNFEELGGSDRESSNAGSQKPGIYIELIPVGDKKSSRVGQPKRLWIHINARSGLVDEVAIDQYGGNRTRIHLRKVDLNPGLPGRIFDWNPPKGASIVERS